MTIQEVADYLKVSTRSVHTWVKEGRIPTCRVGNQHRIRYEDIKDGVPPKTRKEPTAKGGN